MDKKIIEEVKKEMENVPFGNSHFQNVHLSANQETPLRRYRHVLLQMDVKIKALESANFRRRKIELEIEKLKLELEEKENNLNSEIKFINDAVIEVNTFYNIYKNIKEEVKEITRDKFEEEEKKYWVAKLSNDAYDSVLSTGKIELGIVNSMRQIGLNASLAETEILLDINKKKEAELQYLKTLELEKKND